MSTSHRDVLIDARPRGPHGAWAFQRIQGELLISRHLRLARSLNPNVAIVLSRADASSLSESMRETSSDGLRLITREDASIDPNAFVLRSDRLYDPRLLSAQYRSSRSSERAVVWRLDRNASCDAAAEELERRTSYQPFGRFWAWPLARALAATLRPTQVRPNTVTWVAALSFLAATLIVARGSASVASNMSVALLLAFALVLDTADGHLARIQGTASPFGRWLDCVLDELCDVALHAAIGWSLFVASGQTGWLLLALAYVMGKLVFMAGQSIQDDSAEESGLSRVAPSNLRSAVRMLGHADIRWHLWILLAALGRLELALIAWTPYYPLRVLGSGLARRVRHA